MDMLSALLLLQGITLTKRRSPIVLVCVFFSLWSEQADEHIVKLLVI